MHNSKSQDSQAMGGANSSGWSVSTQNSENRKTRISKTSRTKKISYVSEPSPSVGKKEKEKTNHSRKPTKESYDETPAHYIRWEGFDKPRTQLTGWNCELCQKDVAFSPIEYDEVDRSTGKSEEQFEKSILPEATVLPCKHVYHSLCLQFASFGEQLTEPSCPICLSFP